jgi:hypothetical protein
VDSRQVRSHKTRWLVSAHYKADECGKSMVARPTFWVHELKNVFPGVADGPARALTQGRNLLRGHCSQRGSDLRQ